MAMLSPHTFLTFGNREFALIVSLVFSDDAGVHDSREDVDAATGS